MAFTNLLDVVYPVGSIYISATTTSPAETVGGTWTQVTDRYLKAASTPSSIGGSDTFSYSYGLDYLSYYASIGMFNDSKDYERFFGFWDETKGSFEVGTWNRLNKGIPYRNNSVADGMNINLSTEHFGGHITITKPLSPSYYTVCCWVRIS